MSKETQRAIKLSRTLKEFHSDFPINALAIFCCIAEEEGLSSTDLIKKLDTPKATVSRNLRLLGDRKAPNQDGLNLIQLKHDITDYRVRRAYLTEKGKDFYALIEKALK